MLSKIFSKTLGQNIQLILSKYLKCLIKLDRFQYQKANNLGFEVLTDCLDAKYATIAPPTLQVFGKDISENYSEYSSLLQPFEQAASVARSLGQYKKERELLYKRNRLEVFVERIQSKFSSNYITLSISDFLYGFGYHRWKALKLFIFIWFLGTMLACRQFFKKQYNLIDETLDKIEEESKKIGKSKKIPEVASDSLDRFVGSISKVIFNVNSILNGESRQGKENTENDAIHSISDSSNFRCYVQFNLIELEKLKETNKTDFNFEEIKKSNGYAEITFNGKKLKSQRELLNKNFINFANSLDSLHPNHESIGLCNDIFPDSGEWVVGIFSEEILSIINVNDQEDRVNVDENVDENEYKTRTHKYPRSALKEGILPHLISKQFYCLFLIVMLILVLLLYVFSSLALIYQTLFFSILFLSLFGLVVRLCSPDYGWSWRVVLLSMLFSFDILLPIINLDENLNKFVFDDSKGLTRLFFLIQKLTAAILASILLPIFFLTGL